MISGTSNDCARGSTHLVCRVVLWLNATFTTSLVSVLDICLESDCGILWTSAFLVLRVDASTVCKVPEAVKLAEPSLSVNPEIVWLVELDDNVNVLVPVLNVGAEGTVGSGKNREPIRTPALSVISLILDTVAIAPLDWPINFIPVVMYP